MNILFINNFFIGFIVSEIQILAVFGYFPLCIYMYVCMCVCVYVYVCVCVCVCVCEYGVRLVTIFNFRETL